MAERDEEQEPTRPKIVDKRISAGGHTGRPKEAPQSEPAPQDPPRSEGPSIADPAAPTDTPSGPPPPSQEQAWTPEQEEQARRMLEEIAKTPSLDWVLNAAVNLANVAGTKLEIGATADAQLAIDALAGIVNSLGERLEEAYSPLRQTLAQLQMAFAERSGGPAPPSEPQKESGP